VDADMTPEKILRNLENGYFMTHQEQDETAKYIKDLQQSNKAMREELIRYADELFAVRRDLTQLRKQLDEHNPI
jgi:septal ring factor EnvC (AmiA/AmiB activator)